MSLIQWNVHKQCPILLTFYVHFEHLILIASHLWGIKETNIDYWNIFHRKTLGTLFVPFADSNSKRSSVYVVKGNQTWFRSRLTIKKSQISSGTSRTLSTTPHTLSQVSKGRATWQAGTSVYLSACRAHRSVPHRLPGLHLYISGAPIIILNSWPGPV